MKDYYQDIITEKSWRLLQSFRKEADFILIGGWAVYLYTQGLKSKDIDIIIDYQELGKLKTKYNVVKNDRSNKYEIKKEGIDIDIYLPYFSNLGLPVERLLKYKENLEGFAVLKKEVLLLIKLKAYLARKATIKGQKDKLDTISLLFLDDFDLRFLTEYVYTYNLRGYMNDLKQLLMETKEAAELGYNLHFFSKKKRQILKWSVVLSHLV